MKKNKVVVTYTVFAIVLIMVVIVCSFTFMQLNISSQQIPELTSTYINYADDLLLHYEFGNVQNNVVKDQSGNNNNGYIKGNGATFTANSVYLPGGEANSNAAYIELPAEVFENKKEITISVWLKNDTGRGNYSAMYVGTKEIIPTSYWLLNPCNPNGTYKSVITCSQNAFEPWCTEFGISPSNTMHGKQGPVTNDEWALYTTVITEGVLTSYYNGDLIGSVTIANGIDSFGEDLVAYLGRSSYYDNYYKGGIKDVRVYGTALSQ